MYAEAKRARSAQSFRQTHLASQQQCSGSHSRLPDHVELYWYQMKGVVKGSARKTDQRRDCRFGLDQTSGIEASAMVSGDDPAARA